MTSPTPMLRLASAAPKVAVEPEIVSALVPPPLARAAPPFAPTERYSAVATVSSAPMSGRGRPYPSMSSVTRRLPSFVRSVP
jgi:hypothetical protein